MKQKTIRRIVTIGLVLSAINMILNIIEKNPSAILGWTTSIIYATMYITASVIILEKEEE